MFDFFGNTMWISSCVKVFLILFLDGLDFFQSSSILDLFLVECLKEVVVAAALRSLCNYQGWHTRCF